MYAGIVGLPNVGKSTLFNAITKSAVEAANYPFATINPNIGVAIVPDPRLEKLAALINPLKITPAVFRFMDIAGLVKGASKGEGLGNKFLASIREVDLICHVVRCFVDPDIVHVSNVVDPIRDLETINLELILADLEVVQARISRIGKKAVSGDPASALEYQTCKQLMTYLEEGRRPLLSDFHDASRALVGEFNLLSTKPFIYVANVADGDIAQPEANENYMVLKKFAEAEGAKVVAIAARMDAEMTQLSDEERLSFMQDLGIKNTGLGALSKTAYDMLGLRTFFTFGKSEVKAWTFKQGMTAPECAGVIHSDFQKGFIKCETIDWQSLVECGSELEARNRGLMRMEGKDYVMRDGDVCHFRFNVTK